MELPPDEAKASRAAVGYLSDHLHITAGWSKTCRAAVRYLIYVRIVSQLRIARKSRDYLLSFYVLIMSPLQKTRKSRDDLLSFYVWIMSRLRITRKSRIHLLLFYV